MLSFVSSPQYSGQTHCAHSKIVFGSFKLVLSTVVPLSMQDESPNSSKLIKDGSFKLMLFTVVPSSMQDANANSRKSIRDGTQVSHHRLANIALGGLHLFVVTMVAPTLRASQPLLP